MSKRKISAIIIAVFVAVVTSASIISYSLATKESKRFDKNVVAENDVMAYGSNLGNMSYISNIDRIIESSNKESDYTYNIVEIIPGSVAGYDSGLKKYIDSSGFKNYVIDSNKSSATETMKPGTISYKAVTIYADTTLASEVNYGSETMTVQEVLGSADLIYLASPSYTSYTSSSNLPEEIYNWLHNYAMEKDNERPLIFDYVTKNTDTTVQDKTYKDFANAVASNYIKYRTYSWDSSISATDFFGSRGSYYIQYNVNKKKATGNVLIISNNNGSKGTLESALGNGDVIKDNAYYGKGKPSKITFTRKTPSELDGDVGELAAGKYDFIIIEDDVAGTKMSSAVYTALKALSETSNYIIYNASMLSGNSTGSTSADGSNYHKLMSLLVNGSGVAKYSTVLPVTNTFFESLNNAGAAGVESAKSVADIIDYGMYRGNKGGEGSKMFRVLEIEPCYPVDTQLANKQGKYYTDPDNVMKGVTRDEISEGTEYYAFELSKAKIAYATGLNYNQIQLDQMSTNEFISSKEVVVENYDLVYIGGDASALRSADEVSYVKSNNNMTFFGMYTHTGYFVSIYDNNMAGYMGDPTYLELNGNDLTSIKLKELKDYIDAGMPLIVEDKVATAFLESYQYDEKNEHTKDHSRMKQLELRHIDPDSNMYNFLAYAYEAYFEQNPADASQYTGVKNIAFGNIPTKASGATGMADNSERKYGNTLGSFVTVYDGEANSGQKGPINTAIRNLINQSATRPTLVVKNRPADYVEGGSAIEEDSFSVECSVKSVTAGATYKLKLYIDENGDNTFDDDEMVDSADYTDGDDSKTLTYDLPEDFFGLVSWKVVSVVVNTANGSKVETTICDTDSGSSYYKPEVEMKKECRILQIMPVGEKSTQKNGDGHTLYFCTECQQSGKILDGNVFVGNDNVYANGKNGSPNTVGYNDGSKDSVTSVTKNDDGSRTYTYENLIKDVKDVDGVKELDGVKPGLHVHDFGIPIYDTTTRADDWETNFADSLKDDFDFDLTIMTASDFDSLCGKVQQLNDNDLTKKVTINGKEEEVSVRDDTYAVNLKKSIQLKQQIKDKESSGVYEVAKKNVRYAMFEYVRDYSYTIDKCRDIVVKGILGLDNPNDLNDSSKRAALDPETNAGQWLENEEFYKFFEYVNTSCKNIFWPDRGGVAGRQKFKEVRDAWAIYVDMHDEIVELKKDYQEVSCLATTADNWLKNNYDIIVLGFAENFGNRDLTQTSVIQLKSYIDKGGSVLNTHDTMTKYKKSGALNLTNYADSSEEGGQTLREAFGLDRYHVKSSFTNTDATLQFSVTTESIVETNLKVSNGWPYNEQECKISNKDITVTYQWNGDYDYQGVSNLEVEYGDEKPIGDAVELKVQVLDKNGNIKTDVSNKEFVFKCQDQYGNYNQIYQKVVITNGVGSVNVKPITEDNVRTFTQNVNLLNKNATILWTVDENTNEAKITYSDDESDSLHVTVVIQDSAGNNLSERDIQLKYAGKSYNQTSQNGKAVFSDVIKAVATSIYDVSSGSKYRKYTTKDSKYFFTERAKVIDGDYSGVTLGYNSPIGFTDAFISYSEKASGDDRLQYKYARIWNEIFNSTAYDSDWYAYKFNYGTRRAQQVNVGSVTVYPFLVSSTLTVSATHAQAYALDLEDPSVCVWYTLGGTPINDPCGTNGNAWGWTSNFAASPYDGMNNYFIYSKENIFYCGAGHSLITGVDRDNNDERRLFINVIVNSVTKAKSIPKIKLYNVCDKDGNNGHEANCEDNLVSKKGEDNKTLSKKKNTLFYNESLGMYQYNIEEDQEYPLFDFKIIEGNAKLDKVYAFYDLDYGTGDGQDTSSMYTDLSGKPNSKHVLLSGYTDKSVADISGERCKLREKTKNLKLEENYFSNGNATYIVIYAVDKNGEVATARVMINRIPYLFDLTDATIENRHQSFTTYRFLMDITDRTKFNI